MRVESGAARTDPLFKLGFTVLCLGLGLYFLYDWKVGYIAKNRDAAHKQLVSIAPNKELPAEFGQTPTEAAYNAFVAAGSTDPAALRKSFGEPFHSRSVTDANQVEYYVSDYGMVTVPIQLGRIVPDDLRWTGWGKSKDEIEAQFYWAIVSFAIALFAAYRTVKAATLRVVVDDGGMTCAGLRIPAEKMKRLVDFNRKGWVDLYYDAAGNERRLRIDNQRVKRFDEIIDALCALKGFADPRPAPSEDDESDGEEKPEAGEGGGTP